MTRRQALLAACVMLAAAYLAVAALMNFAFDFRFFRSDVAWYWNDSAEGALLNRYHVPGYPLIIAGARAATFGLLNPVFLMMAINVAALIAGAVMVFRAISLAGGQARVAGLAAVGFGLWPLVGLPYTVMPIADVPAMALLLGGLVGLMAGAAVLGGLLLGLSMVTHKAMWLFAAAILLARLFSGTLPPMRKAAMAVAAAAPIGILWSIGFLHYGAADWIVSSNLAVGAETRELPLFDGLRASLRGGAARALVKGGMLLFVAALAAALTAAFLRHRRGPALYAVAIAGGVLVLAATLTHNEIWAVARFSRLLILPAAWWAAVRGWNIPVWAAGLGVGAVLLSQFMFAWYVSAVFFH